MATGNHSSPTTPSLATAPRRNWRRRVVLGVLAIVAILLAVFWSSIRSYGMTGASYGARVACSCRFAGGRALSDCRKDFEPGMELVTLSEDTEAKSVTAAFAMLFRQTATYRESSGCVLEPWKP